MDFIKTLIDTPAPTLLMIGGLIFLLLGLVTFKKPIVIEVTPTNRKIALLFGVLLIGIAIFLLSIHIPEDTQGEIPTETNNLLSETPTISVIPSSTLEAVNPITNTPPATSSRVFGDGCISPTTWLTSTSTQYRLTKDNCLDLSENGIFASNGDLVINIQSETPRVSTIYMPIQETKNIKFNVRIDKFNSAENGNIAFGISGKECKITDGEFIFYRSSDSKIFQISGFSALEYGDTLGKYDIGSTDSFEFNFDKSTFEFYLNGLKVKNGIIQTSESTFCISYRFPEHVYLSSVITDFYIEK